MVFGDRFDDGVQEVAWPDSVVRLELVVRCPVAGFAAGTHVKALVHWATGKRLTNRLPKLSLVTLSPPSEQRGPWSSYGAVRA